MGRRELISKSHPTLHWWLHHEKEGQTHIVELSHLGKKYTLYKGKDRDAATVTYSTVLSTMKFMLEEILGITLGD